MNNVFSLGNTPGNVTESAEYVVVGTGAAGAVAGWKLASAGHSVIFVEEGPYVPQEEFVRDTFTSFAGTWRDAGFQVAKGRAFLPILQGRCVGGSTLINGAIVHRIPPAIAADWAQNYGAGQLFSEAKLGRAFDELDALFSVAPGPEEVLGENNKLMRQGIEAMGWTGNVIARNVVRCEGSSRCMQGCRNARKQSTNFTFIPKATELGARVFANSRVDRFLLSGSRVNGVTGKRVDVRGAESGEFKITATKAVILAASAIQTPLLLKKSGIGKRSGLVGRRFQCHPGSSLVGIFDQKTDIWFGATQGYESKHFWDERMKFEAVGIPLEIGAARLPGFGAPLMQRIADFEHIVQWGVQIRSEAHGRVRRGIFGTDIRFDFTNADVHRMKIGLDRICQAMFAAGATMVLPGIHGMPEEIHNPSAFKAIFDLPDDPRLFHAIAAHLFGTAVMGTDPARSVVDPTGKCHDIDGLYVADSSIFPTNMGVNPAHTISAMALLIAENLLDSSGH